MIYSICTQKQNNAKDHRKSFSNIYYYVFLHNFEQEHKYDVQSDTDMFYFYLFIYFFSVFLVEQTFAQTVGQTLFCEPFACS